MSATRGTAEIVVTDARAVEWRAEIEFAKAAQRGWTFWQARTSNLLDTREALINALSHCVAVMQVVGYDDEFSADQAQAAGEAAEVLLFQLRGGGTA